MWTHLKIVAKKRIEKDRPMGQVCDRAESASEFSFLDNLKVMSSLASFYQVHFCIIIFLNLDGHFTTDCC